MPKNILKTFLILLFFVSIYGCGTGGNGVHVRSYVEEKPRVDQQMSGNAGYLAGSTESARPEKTTRKVYVLEFSKEAEIPEGTEQQAETSSSMGSQEEMVSENSDVSSMDKSEEEPEAVSKPASVQYKVEKDDTLQKISKKFYGSYGKWTKIYQVNKEKIKDPDHIKPGIVISIPME